MSHPTDHPCDDVRDALIRLTDALCTWERTTGRSSVLILREQGGFAFRAMDGKPIDSFVADAQLLGLVAP